MATIETSNHHEHAPEIFDQLLSIFQDGFAMWDNAHGTEARAARAHVFENVLNEVEHAELVALWHNQDQAGIFQIAERHRQAAMQADNPITRTAERAKYLHLTHTATLIKFIYANPTATLAAHREAYRLPEEYGGYNQLPPPLVRRYLTAAEEVVNVTIARDHDFGKAKQELEQLIVALSSYDADRYDTDGMLIGAHGNLAMCELELGNLPAAKTALARAREIALTNHTAPGEYFAVYVQLLTLAYKHGADIDASIAALEDVLRGYTSTPESACADANPVVRHIGTLRAQAPEHQAVDLYTRRARRDVEVALLTCKLKSGASDYEEYKQIITRRWQRERVEFAGNACEISTWQMQAFNDEITTKHAEIALAEAEASNAAEMAVAKYNEAIKLYETVGLSYHAADAAMSLLETWQHQLGTEEAKQLFFHYWPLLESQLGQDVMSLFDGSATTVSPQITRMKTVICRLFGAAGESDIMTFHIAAREAAKYLERKSKADRERQLLRSADSAALDTDARAAFGTAGLFDCIPETGTVHYSDHAMTFDLATVLAHPDVAAAIERARTTGLPQEARHIFTTAETSEEVDALEQLIVIADGERVFGFHTGRSGRHLSETEQKLLLISVLDGLLSKEQYDVDRALQPAIETGWTRPGEADYTSATRVAQRVYLEILGVLNVTSAPLFVHARATTDGRELGGVAVNPLHGKISYPQIFFGDDIFAKTGINPNHTCEIGSLAIEPLSRKWLTPILFELVADCGLDADCEHGVMVANKMVVRLLKNFGVAVTELGEPDIDDPTIQQRLRDKKGWTDSEINDWKKMYFDRLKPIIAAISLRQLKSAMAAYNNPSR